MPDLLPWLATLWLLTLLGFPAAHLILRRLPDRGWGISRTLALLLLAWLTWLGGTAGIIPNSPAGIWATLTLLAAGSAALAWRQRTELLDFIRRCWPILVVTELLFLAVFAFWTLVVSEVPAINHTEKPMDFGIMNAVALADRFPPQDHWLAGHPVAYYYGGHLIAALLSTMSGVPTDTAYNLMLATLPALLAAGISGLTYGLLRLAGARIAPALAGGAATALAVILLGNLSGVPELAYARGLGAADFWQWLGIKGLLEAPAGAAAWFPEGHFWWWRGSRIIDTLSPDGASLDYTITETPFFSFLLGDLHAHSSALPFAALALTLALAMLTAPHPPGLAWLRQRPCEFPTLALALGALAFINTWDFPLYIVIIAAAAGLRRFTAGGGPWPALMTATALAAALAIAGALLYLPFYLSFDSQAAGILPTIGPATRPIHFLIVMGLPTLLAAGLTIRALLQPPETATPRPEPAGTTALRPQPASTATPRPEPASTTTSRPEPARPTAPQPEPASTTAPQPEPASTTAPQPEPTETAVPPSRNLSRNLALTAAAISAAPLLLWLAAAALRIALAPAGELTPADGFITGRMLLALPLLAIAGLTLYAALLRASHRSPASHQPPTSQRPPASNQPPTSPAIIFALLLAAAGFYLLAGAELFHIADLFGNRMNTVFKVYYQAWLLLGIAGAVAVYHIITTAIAPPIPGARWTTAARPLLRRAPAALWATLAALLLLASAYYPTAALLERTGWAQDGESWNDNTLSGTDYLRHFAPDEYHAIQWLNRQPGPGAIVTAVGDSYTDYGRIASATGRATILAWESHEIQWRGDARAFAGRRDDVATIYESADGAAVTDLLRQYAVRWVIVGPRERETHGDATPRRMAQWVSEGRLTPAFSAGSIAIYEVQ